MEDDTGREGGGEQLRTFSTDCPLTNISRLALCIHVQCTLINSTVDDTSGPALCFPVEKARRDGVEFKQLGERGGQSRGVKETDQRRFVCGRVVAWGCWLAVEPVLRQHRSAAVGEESGAEQSSAERSSTPGRGNGEAVGWG